MDRILMTIKYDGSGFFGWQRQEGVRTVQGTIEEALSMLFKKPIKIIGTSRTDRGVHALGQRAVFDIDELKIPISNLKRALNNALCAVTKKYGPQDVLIQEVELVEPVFHPRYDAKDKLYRYLIRNTREYDPFERLYSYHIAEHLDTDDMLVAAEMLEGTNDYASFQSAGGTPRESTVRTIYSIDIGRDNDEVEILIRGDGFLYNMVRIIVGTLVEVGLGKRKPDSVKEALLACDRCEAGHTAPAEGLYLVEITY